MEDEDGKKMEEDGRWEEREMGKKSRSELLFFMYSHFYDFQSYLK
jgi:hypothetical protein